MVRIIRWATADVVGLSATMLAVWLLDRWMDG